MKTKKNKKQKGGFLYGKSKRLSTVRKTSRTTKTIKNTKTTPMTSKLDENKIKYKNKNIR